MSYDRSERPLLSLVKKRGESIICCVEAKLLFAV